ncbi:MAG: exodeoxyribonuclease III [Gammaproteobacteria bacterium]|nr:exodeoxyribonuclease III [Gammaproteobacteria bacterium]
MRIISWNVNGLRACVRKGFHEFLESSGADVLCLQEVRALPEQLDQHTLEPVGWYTNFFPAERKGYAGVAIFSREKPTRVITELPEEEFNIEGRYIVAKFGRLSIASIYFPKGSGKDRDNSRVAYKLAFYRSVKRALDRLRASGPTFALGDFNTAHTEIDLARPKTNTKTSGFLPEERAEFTRWMENGWVDVFRNQHRDEPDHYTWWRQWGGAKENNVGWRIDYVLASRSAAKTVTNAFIWPHIDGSDHCPIGVDTLIR